ncbi:hypothetical protein ACFW38_002854 [Salmonella enterica]|nr:hypothetical protein [Salmonella enterica]EIJ0490577.1 hypothetical protein [Salmonella enterica]EJH1666868.1 hypothetical protein [Salmonella enterica]
MVLICQWRARSDEKYAVGHFSAREYVGNDYREHRGQISGFCVGRALLSGKPAS